MEISYAIPAKPAVFLATEKDKLLRKIEGETRQSAAWYEIRVRINAVDEATNILESFGVHYGIGIIRNELEASIYTARELREVYGRMFDAGMEDIYADELKRLIPNLERLA